MRGRLGSICENIFSRGSLEIFLFCIERNPPVSPIFVVPPEGGDCEKGGGDFCSIFSKEKKNGGGRNLKNGVRQSSRGLEKGVLFFFPSSN